MPTPRATTRRPATRRTTASRGKVAAAKSDEAAADVKTEETGMSAGTPQPQDLPGASAEAAKEDRPEAAAEAGPIAPEATEAVADPAMAAEPEPTVQDMKQAVEFPADALIDNVTVGQQEAMETANAAGAAIFDGLGRVQREIATFVADRVRQDIETQRAFLNCRTLDDVQEVQRRFIRSAMEQYAAETTRLMSLGREIMTRSTGRE